ncbi:MAG: RelA/SpoT family protein [Candidatus Competibacterales bacterium]|nr:RelA/SpoT family protein [Candidatus Competibacterales bacterium]
MSMAGAVAYRPPDDDWSAAIAARIDAICASLSSYLTPEQVAAIRDACWFAARAHDGVYRKSGEPYIFHPLAVVEILCEVRLDHQALMAAVLHDVIEDTSCSKGDLSARFGGEVAELVDGVSKLTQIAFASRLEAQAENFRKMFMAMARDIRVIMIKLADRLHNMRTLDAMVPVKRRRIARETLDIYAPIAMRLGMERLRRELEDLGFRHLYPLRYRTLQAALARRGGERREIIAEIETRISERLRELGLEARLSGREKPLWSLYCKMRDKRLHFREIHDIYAVRVIVDEVDACYRVLGCLHGLYKPVMGRFKDYIAIPKANGYQSLHTTLFGPQGLTLEAQIRTRDMHIMAQTGIAAHWLYKSRGEQPGGLQSHARDWLQQLLDIQRRAGNSVEFLENVKIDLFPNDIFVFTPGGDIVELPRGATAIDFAYAIHSDVGNTCVGAKVNHRFVPLRTRLGSGQTVEVIISPTARPDPAWLGFVVTAKARASIRHYLNHLKREEAVILGRRLLENALPGSAGRLRDIPRERIAAVVAQLRAPDFDSILADIGFGRRLAPLIAKYLRSPEEPGAPADDDQPLLIKGSEGAVISFGKCCRPIPGDHIIGHLSTGRGIVIHRDTCRNVAAEFERAPDKWLEVEWESDISGDFPAALRLHLNNHRGVLATVAVAAAEAGANIDTINTSERDGATTTVDVMVNVRDRAHLAQVLRRLRGLRGVLRIFRRG